MPRAWVTERVCSHCDQAFKPERVYSPINGWHSSSRKTCSDDCRSAANRKPRRKQGLCERCRKTGPLAKDTQMCPPCRQHHTDSLRAEAQAESRARWRRAHPEYDWERRARRLGVEIEISSETAEYVAAIRSDPCSYCSEMSDTADHIVPVSAGGSNDWVNLTGACRSCNSRKNKRSLLEALLLMR